MTTLNEEMTMQLSGRVHYGDEHLEVHFANKFVTLDSRRLVLTRKEYELLTLLVEHAGELVPRAMLLRRVWGYGNAIRTRTLDVHIRRLRKHLGECSWQYIETIFGVGYRFTPFRAPWCSWPISSARRTGYGEQGSQGIVIQASGMSGVSGEYPVGSSLDQIAEHQLIRRLQAGNDAAFYEFVAQYGSRVCAVAHRMLGSRDDADDIAQQVFAKVSFAIKSFEGRSSLYTWVHRITVNECYGFLRKKPLATFIDCGQADTAVPARVQMTPDPSPTSETVTVQRDFLQRLLAGVAEEDRQLLLLRELEGYSVSQLAAATGINPNTIKTRLMRTRRKLIARREPATCSIYKNKKENVCAV